MEQVSATRSELLSRRARIQIAAQGCELLKERRSALVREFHRLGTSALRSLDALDRDATWAGQFLRVSTATDGREPLESAAFAAGGTVDLDVRTRNVAGVPVVEIDKEKVARARTDRGYSLAATTARTDAVAEHFETILDSLLEVAALELSVRRLAEDIGRTTRRINALEHIVLPRLESERAHIALVLDERELEDRVRLRRMRTTKVREGAPR